MPALLVAFMLLVATTPPLGSWTAARTLVVRGTVKDASGAPIAGANVYTTPPSSQTAGFKLSAADGS